MLKQWLNPGDIVLLEIPFTDLSGSKKRPACVLSSKGKDVLVAFITSKLDQAGLGDVILKKTLENGLAVDSAVLVQKLFTLHQSLMIRRLGACLSHERRTILKGIIQNLSKGL